MMYRLVVNAYPVNISETWRFTEHVYAHTHTQTFIHSQYVQINVYIYIYIQIQPTLLNSAGGSYAALMHFRHK